ncbi:MAG: D-alanyl-D-alanine carboxypeptidase [Saccharofermentans sp.]|nr:D-alanyl-D-alanine carboxypeptidase [Saccharofermentans sp.]
MLKTRRTFKALVAALLSIVLITAQMPAYVYAINEDFDDPEDNLISQNEQVTDLLSEPAEGAPEVSASTYILLDADSGSILRGVDYNVQKEPASMTKVMTVLLALERLEMTEVVTITPAMAESFASITEDYVKLGLQEGEEMTVKDLVYAAVLKSANDASLALGMYMGGTEQAFCNIMNEKASDIGCLNTHFSSAYGLSTPDNVTTAYDMALILNEAVTNTNYTEIARTYSYTIAATNKYSDTRELTNANRFISTTEYGYDYYIGGKTGFTDTAGYTLCAAAKKDGRTLIGVVFNAADSAIRYADLIHLFDYGYSNYTTVQVSEEEFLPLIDDTRGQLESLLANTTLYIKDQTISMSQYVTTTSVRAQLGSSNSIDLSQVVIDTSADSQTINIPLCKCYQDKQYIVGSLSVRIEQKSAVVEITPEKNTELTTVRGVLISFAVISGLILILIIALIIFRHQVLKRRRIEENKPSNML